MNFSPYDARQQEIDQRARYAEALMQQGMESPQGQMAGRIYVPPSWTQGLAQMLKAYGGRKGMDVASEQTKGLAAERTKAMVDALKGYGAGGNPAALLESPDTAAFGVQAMGQERQAKMQAEAAALEHSRALERDAAKSASKPPETRTFMQGSEKVTQQYDPSTKTWTEVGRGPAFNPNPSTVVQNYPAPVPVIGPDGKPRMVQFGNKGDVIETPYQPLPKAALSGKDLSTANAKIQAAQNLKRQIAEARQRFQAIQGTLAAGPITGLNPFSEPGQQFDATIDALRSTVTALTRTPGVGAMSDYETRLDQSKIPSRGKYESVTAQQLDELEALADGIIGGYSDMVGAPPVAPVAPGAGATGGWGEPKKGGTVKWGDL